MSCRQVKQEALSKATKLLSGFCLSMQVQLGVTYVIFRTSAKWKSGTFFARSRVKSHQVMFLVGFPCGSNGKELAYNAGDLSSIPGLGKIRWSGKWQPTPVFLPREFHGTRSLADYRPWGGIEQDKTEPLTPSLSTFLVAPFFYNALTLHTNQLHVSESNFLRLSIILGSQKN